MIFGVRVKIPKNKPATPVSDCIFTLTPNIGDRFKICPRPVRKLVWDYD